jgi:hypothetical protein
MKVAEWVSALQQLPQEMELVQLVQVVCAHCRDVTVATGWGEDGDPMSPGWRRQEGKGDVSVCSAECADAASRAAVLAGKKRPRWRLCFE